MKKTPSVDLRDCRGCDSCLEVCPAVFEKNEETGLIQVVDLPQYPEEQVDEAIRICPTHCITWEER